MILTNDNILTPNDFGVFCFLYNKDDRFNPTPLIIDSGDQFRSMWDQTYDHNTGPHKTGYYGLPVFRKVAKPDELKGSVSYLVVKGGVPVGAVYDGNIVKSARLDPKEGVYQRLPNRWFREYAGSIKTSTGGLIDSIYEILVPREEELIQGIDIDAILKLRDGKPRYNVRKGIYVPDENSLF